MYKKYNSYAIVVDKITTEQGYNILVFTREFGLLNAYAKSAQKQGAKLKSLLEPGSFVEITILKSRASFKVVGVSSHKKIIKDFDAWRFFARVIKNLLPKEIVEEEIFNVSLKFLSGKLSSIQFLAFVLRTLGFASFKNQQIFKETDKNLKKQIMIQTKKSMIKDVVYFILNEK